MRARIVIALAATAALAGCQESGFDESRETQRPLKVQHAMDQFTGTRVPGVAKRPMTLTADTLGDTLALGVEPVRAALPGAELPAYLREEARGVEVVPPLTKLDLAATEAAEPDVILGAKESGARLYRRLKRIAPTVMTEGDNWKLNLRLHGEALGRTNDSERLLIDWDKRVARARKRLREAGVAVTLEGRSSPFARQILADLGPVGGRPGGSSGGGATETVRIDASGEHWSGGGVLAARAALADVARAASGP